MSNYHRYFKPLALGLLLSTPVVFAADVDVKWQEPDTFSDLRTSSTLQSRFEETVLADLEQHFRESAAAALPDNQHLSLTITDVDLAGYIDYFQPRNPFGMRLVRNVDFPRIKLNYALKDEQGNILKEGESTLKDLGFQTPAFYVRNSDPLKYEKRMIDRWINSSF